MPQKLIRLTSDTGDGIFKGIFNENIEIKENSEIALQSLSVERKSQSINITNSNNDIAFSSTGVAFNQTGEIFPVQTYDKTNSVSLLAEISNAANRSCSMLTTPSNMNIQWKCGLANSGKVRISGSVSPFYTLSEIDTGPGLPDAPTFSILNKSVINNIVGAEVVKAGELFQAGETGIFRENDTTATPLNSNESYMWGNIPFIKSTGTLRTRFKRLNTNGAGSESFTMGLVKGASGLEKLRNSTITDDDMVYAIRVFGHNAVMKFKANAADPFITTGATPINHTVANPLNKNDVIEIILDNNKFIGQIHQNSAVGGGGTDNLIPLAGSDVTDGEDYYWFISLYEGKDNLVLDLTNVSLDPFTAGGDEAPLLTANQRLTQPPDESALSTLVLYNRDQVLSGSWRFVPEAVGDNSLANFLGWPRPDISPIFYQPKRPARDYNGQGDYDLTIGFYYEAPEIFDTGVLVSNYLIDTQSFTLDSFDSYGLSANERNAKSGGSRRNILATIPTNAIPIAGTSNSLVQFEPATLNYIYIKNKGDVITRQLRFRLLTSTYEPVKTEGIAAMTLLIKEI